VFAPLFVTLTRVRGDRVEVNLAAAFSMREESDRKPDAPCRQVTVIESILNDAYVTVKESLDEIRRLEAEARAKLAAA
jgi:hypothetical protein